MTTTPRRFNPWFYESGPPCVHCYEYKRDHVAEEKQCLFMPTRYTEMTVDEFTKYEKTFPANERHLAWAGLTQRGRVR